MAANPYQGTTAAGRYAELMTSRSPYLERARDAAKLTIPALLPPEGSSGSTELVKPYQSVGAEGVKNLASKLMLALFPPNQPFFRYMLPPSVLAELAGQPSVKGEIDQGLVRIETEVQAEVETTAIRTSMAEALKHLIVTGNTLLQELPQGGLKVHRLDRYVVKRDPAGNVLEVVIKESVAPAALPPRFLAALRRTDEATRQSPTATLDIYTWIRRDGPVYRIFQEVRGEVVSGTQGTYPLDRLPFIPLRWTKVDGEDYGRSHIDDVFGDLRSLEGLTAAIVEGSAAAAKMIFFVDPTGVTRVNDVANAPNLAVRSGRAQDVTVIKADKVADFQTAMQTSMNIERRLSASFLMTRSVQRQGERVTAEEIRLLAGELEDALGGVYALLSQELQLPYVKVVMGRLAREGRIPDLPKNIRPAIVTGLEALGRSHELNRLMMLGRAIRELLGDGALTTLKPDALIAKIGTALGVDTKEIIKTQEEMKAEAAESRRAALAEKLGPEVIRSQAAAQQQQPQEAMSAPTQAE